MKKKITIFTGIAVVVIAIAVLAIAYLTNAYSSYERAYDKLFKTGSMELKLTSTVNMDNKEIKTTGTMKLANDKGVMKFVADMFANGADIKMFSDGKYVYRDIDGQKTKMEIGGKPSQGEKGAFDMKLLEQEFANLLEPGKIKETKILDKVDESYVSKITKKSISTGKQYTIKLSDKVADTVFEALVNSQKDSGANVSKPEFTKKSFDFFVFENKKGYLCGMNYVVDMDMKLPASLTNESSDKKSKVKINMKVEVVNPGQAVKVVIPDTNGYDMQ